MLLRDQRSTTLSQSSQQIAGPNGRRRALVITAPPSLANPETYTGDQQGGVSTATTGVKASYTVPAGLQATLDSATFVETTGTTVVSALQVVRGATTYTLASYTTAGAYTGKFPLQPGDKIQWNVTTAIAASVSDYTISVALDNASQRITVSFTSPAVLDQGINLQPGTLPLELGWDVYGDALTEPIYAVASAGSPTIGILDIFAA